MKVFPQKTKATVLVVDEDPEIFLAIKKRLKRQNLKFLDARSVAEAQGLIDEYGIDSFDCVVTDVFMPKKMGLEFLDWVKERDSSLSMVILSGGEEEKGIVRHSLRQGASDFLEKPLDFSILEGTLERAIRGTHRNRQLVAMEARVNEVARMGHLFQSYRAPQIESRLTSFFRPLSAVGGDFINVLPLGDERYLFIAGDVSGHDVKAAFVSAYFQGMARGLLDHQRELHDVLKDFNGILAREWIGDDGSFPVSSEVVTSLAACAVVVDFKQNVLEVFNCGFPPLWIVESDGRCRAAEHRNPPLGWIEVDRFDEELLNIDGIAFFYIFSDGLTDYASNLKIDPFCLTFRLLSDIEEHTFSTQPPDDILVMRFQLDNTATAEDLFEPLIYEQYVGKEYSSIDRIQNVWRRSLRYALSDDIEDRIDELLLCCREGVLNALVYGCKKAADRSCAFQVSYNRYREILRVQIDDSGKGHHFDVDERIARMDLLEGEHMGIAIIKELSDRIAFENDGTSLIFDFSLMPEYKIS